MIWMVYKDNIMDTATTIICGGSKYTYDRITNEFLDWVRDIPLESDAVSNVKKLLEQYESRKTFWQKFKSLFNI